ncbi:hypothetical protein [Oceanobacillus senegalensis]|nr:hypothetical protein [Oceanobacillus senegalensis]
MRNVDWSMVMFVMGPILNDAWLLWGLPRIYYWNMKKENNTDGNNHNRAA